jgi:hypothetical protein
MLPTTPRHLQRNAQYLPFGPWPTGANAGRVTPKETGQRPKLNYKNAQTDSARDVPTLIEKDVSNVLGKSNLVCKAKFVDTRRPRSESSPPFPVRLAVTSQSTTSQPLQGSRSSARAPLLKPMALQLESENKPTPLVRAIQLLTQLPPCTVHKPSIQFQASDEAALHNWNMLREKETNCQDCYWSSRSQ